SGGHDARYPQVVLEEIRVGHQEMTMGAKPLRHGLREDDLRVASVVASRSELEPEAIQTFERLGLGREESDTGGRRRGLFGRRRAAVRLERFVLQYARARDLSAPLGVFEDEIPAREDEDDPSSVAEGAGLVIEAARAAWSIQLSVDAESVEALERALALRAQPPTVLAPRVVRSIADFVAQVLLETYPGAEIDPEDVPRLLLPRPSGLPWTTDPEARVIEHVRRGPRASLAGYLRELMTTPPT
ncbi:MAG: hypothetical protein AAFZ18_02035, partial [Myxococcota bacterium]